MRLALIFLLFVSVPPSPASDNASFFVKKLEDAYKHPRTLQAAFLQEYSEGGKTTRTEAGIAYFRRPGKMRWEYASPEKNLFVVDGKFAWFYVPADRTVSRVAAKQSEDWRTPLALLAGEMKVSRVCAKVELADSQPSNPALARVACVIRGTEKDVKSAAPHDTAYFEIVRSTGELDKVVVASPSGVRMEMRFSNWKFDPPAGEQLFQFQPPKGVAIVDGDQLLPGPSSAAW
ncbi:MAG: outer membrane lipoprotein carrier protein LolA [Acidobacteria bacterium]|nr:outer membrane lipoprotein carrier protein LolA [Acidobacteriota bacterium]